MVSLSNQAVRKIAASNQLTLQHTNLWPPWESRGTSSVPQAAGQPPSISALCLVLFLLVTAHCASNQQALHKSLAQQHPTHPPLTPVRVTRNISCPSGCWSASGLMASGSRPACGWNTTVPRVAWNSDPSGRGVPCRVCISHDTSTSPKVPWPRMMLQRKQVFSLTTWPFIFL